MQTLIAIIIFSSFILSQQVPSEQNCLFSNCFCSSTSINCSYLIQNTQNSMFPTKIDQYNNHEFESVEFSGYQFKTIPSNVFNQLSISKLHFSKNGLEIIDSESLNGINNLKHLSINEPNFKKFQKYSLLPVKDTLETLDLSNSNLNTDCVIQIACNKTMIARNLNAKKKWLAQQFK